MRRDAREHPEHRVCCDHRERQVRGRRWLAATIFVCAAALALCSTLYMYETLCNELEKEMGKTLPWPRQAAMLCSMRSYLRNPVSLPLPEEIDRCNHETLHQLQACRIAQAGGS